MQLRLRVPSILQAPDAVTTGKLSGRNQSRGQEAGVEANQKYTRLWKNRLHSHYKDPALSEVTRATWGTSME